MTEEEKRRKRGNETEAMWAPGIYAFSEISFEARQEASRAPGKEDVDAGQGQLPPERPAVGIESVWKAESEMHTQLESRH